MIIKELIYVRKQNIKSILLLRDNTSSGNNNDQEFIYKPANEYRIVLHENHQRVKYEYQEDDK